MPREITLSLEPDGPTASGFTSPTPTRTRGEQLTIELLFLPQDHGEYAALQERLGFVDAVYTGRSHDGVPWVDEQLPARAPVTSQILRVTPGADIPDFDPFWGVLVGGEDQSRPPQGQRRVSIDVVYLAEGSRYADRAAVEADLGATSIL
ncbi:hypothetical protein [Halobacterium hubeiense]|uniref:hypothetical protein n=1 Tax=Halobacterium hubeiense TaxID=1407499 RepID=UPI000B7C90A8|nr:hypothetical protein [Halobacterium hubeiense]